jgi:hypothetical protein
VGALPNEDGRDNGHDHHDTDDPSYQHHPLFNRIRRAR